MREPSLIVRQLLRGWQKPGWLNWLCLPVSGVYGIVMRLRHQAYHHGLLTVTKLPVPVIVVGNLSVGGTGKSPLVTALARWLVEQGWRPGIVSRGYGGSADQSLLVTDRHTTEQTGDEPMMFHQAGIAPVAVGRDRAAAARLLAEQAACNVIISDDGFQHLRLWRDIDIVVVDGERGFGNGWALPAGPLREPRSALGRADLFVINSGPEISADHFGLPGPRFPMSMRPHRVRTLLGDGSEETLAQFAVHHSRVIAMAGLGNPERFFRCLEAAVIMVTRIPLSDHHTFSSADFSSLPTDQAIVMTEKDAVKCRALADAGALGSDLCTRIYVLGAVAELSDDFYDAVGTQLSKAAHPESRG